MQGDVVFAAAVEGGPDSRRQSGDDEQAERQHPVESLVAASAACVHQRELGMENMSSGPEGDLTQRPMRGDVEIFHAGDGNQGTEDLVAYAEQREVNEAESEGDAKAEAPVRSLRFLLERSDWDFSTHGKPLGALKFTTDPISLCSVWCRVARGGRGRGPRSLLR